LQSPFAAAALLSAACCSMLQCVILQQIAVCCIHLRALSVAVVHVCVYIYVCLYVCICRANQRVAFLQIHFFQKFSKISPIVILNGTIKTICPLSSDASQPLVLPLQKLTTPLIEILKSQLATQITPENDYRNFGDHVGLPCSVLYWPSCKLYLFASSARTLVLALEAKGSRLFACIANDSIQ